MLTLHQLVPVVLHKAVGPACYLTTHILLDHTSYPGMLPHAVQHLTFVQHKHLHMPGFGKQNNTNIDAVRRGKHAPREALDSPKASQPFEPRTLRSQTPSSKLS